ncbi:unnamed protein product [Arabidopsis halleri]
MKQQLAVLHLEEKCERAIDWALELEPSIKHMVVSGGVASNKYVRLRLNNIVENKNLKLVCPPPSLCTDNGVVVAWTGLEHFRVGRYNTPPPATEPDDFVVASWRGVCKRKKQSSFYENCADSPVTYFNYLSRFFSTTNINVARKIVSCN